METIYVNLHNEIPTNYTGLIIYASGHQEYYLDDKRYEKEEWEIRVKELKSNKSR